MGSGGGGGIASFSSGPGRSGSTSNLLDFAKDGAAAGMASSCKPQQQSVSGTGSGLLAANDGSAYGGHYGLRARAPSGSQTSKAGSGHGGSPGSHACDAAPNTLPYQQGVKEFYTSTNIQVLVAIIITANFVVTIVEKEVDPYPKDNQQYAGLWRMLSIMFNILFLVELIVNFYGHYFLEFWKNSWNVFDFIVVVIGILDMSNTEIGPFEDLKILRAFRVFRLFKRVESLNKIIVSLVRAIPSVFSAFVILFIFMSIYAILATEFFSHLGMGTDSSGPWDYTTVLQEGVPPNEEYENQLTTSLSVRKLPYGQEYWGTFFRSMYSLFQVMTGESWCEMVVRPAIFGYDSYNAVVPAMFFVSWVIIAQVVLLNVVIAVLLDKFSGDDSSQAKPPAAQVPDPAGPGDELAANDENNGPSFDMLTSKKFKFSTKDLKDPNEVLKEMERLKEAEDELDAQLQRTSEAFKKRVESVQDIMQRLESAGVKLSTVKSSSGSHDEAANAAAALLGHNPDSRAASPNTQKGINSRSREVCLIS